ncbi:MAG: hypothetical protein V3U87_10720, partial [Methylococcaceae bacterium]
GSLPNIRLSGLFRSAPEPNNQTFDRRFYADNRRCRGHYQRKTRPSTPRYVQNEIYTFIKINNFSFQSLKK